MEEKNRFLDTLDDDSAPDGAGVDSPFLSLARRIRDLLKSRDGGALGVAKDPSSTLIPRWMAMAERAKADRSRRLVCNEILHWFITPPPPIKVILPTCLDNILGVPSGRVFSVSSESCFIIQLWLSNDLPVDSIKCQCEVLQYSKIARLFSCYNWLCVYPLWAISLEQSLAEILGISADLAPDIRFKAGDSGSNRGWQQILTCLKFMCQYGFHSIIIRS